MKKDNSIAIEVKGLTKRFDSLLAVDSVSFEVYTGEIFGFLGPNGAGKTTTIRMLTGLLSPDKGDIFIEGKDFSKETMSVKMDMGVIPEFGTVYRDLSSYENIILTGKFYGMDKKVLFEKTEFLLKQFDLYEKKDIPVMKFSKGMQQRVNIASALVHNPKILFLDEPTGGLDVQSQRLIKNIIKEMNSNGTTVFLTTHNIEKANALCDRVAIIDRGKIVVIDAPEKLKSTFRETQSVVAAFDKPVVASLIESYLSVKTEKSGDKWRVYTDNPDMLVKKLTRFAEGQGLSFTLLEICGPSLEDVFVKLTEKGKG